MPSVLPSQNHVTLPADAHDRIGKATLPVRLSTLSASGVETVRILSESRLVELLQGIVADTLADVRAAAGTASAMEAGRPAAEGLDPGLAASYRETWSELRGKHQESLRRIEGRMEKLARVFRGLEGAVSRLDGPVVPATGAAAPAANPPASEDRKRQLLREMLLQSEG